MSEHTKEPWRQGKRFPSRILADNANVAATALCQDEDSPTEIEIANARRIVACVNACAGIETDELEQCATRFPNDRAGTLRMLHHIAGFASGAARDGG